VAAVALALLVPRGAPHSAALASLEELLAPEQEVARELIAAELDARRGHVESLTRSLLELQRAREIELRALNSALETMDRDNRALDQAVRELAAENRRVRTSRSFRLGKALTETNDVWSALSLPMRMVRAAREKPPIAAEEAPDGSGAG
jgi:hypothetical protein